MSLSNFFRINLPYGLARNEKKKWMAFNREYLPLGCNNQDNWQQENSGYKDSSVHSQYMDLSEKLLEEIADESTQIVRNENGEIVKVWLYSDGTNPTNSGQNNSKYWNGYFNKLKKLSVLEANQYAF